jgi:hypothetical protein
MEAHGRQGFYLGASMEHYRSYRVYMISSRKKRITDSCAWFPATVNMPGANPAALLDKTLRALTRNRKGSILPRSWNGV